MIKLSNFMLCKKKCTERKSERESVLCTDGCLQILKRCPAKMAFIEQKEYKIKKIKVENNRSLLIL